MAESLHQNMRISDTPNRLRGTARSHVGGSHASMPSRYKTRPSTQSTHRTISDFHLPIKASNINKQPEPLTSSQIPIDPTSQAAPKVREHIVYKAQPAQVRPYRSQVLLRQSFVPNLPMRQLRFNASRSTLVLWSMAVMIFLVGTGVSIFSLSTNSHARAQVAQLAQANNTGTDKSVDIPTENPPSGNLNDYQVAPSLPRFITIPKFNVKSRVLPLGIKDNNEIKVPAGIYDAGWYDGSAKPGETGAVLIDGHVSGPTKPGVFSNLKNLKAGDVIGITRGDGQELKYNVVKTVSYSAQDTDMVAALKPVSGKKGLNLITCGGKFNVQKQVYEDRIIVFATQLE